MIKLGIKIIYELRKRARYHDRIAKQCLVGALARQWHLAARDGMRGFANDIKRGHHKLSERKP